jgi:hypothetical protein
MVWVSISQFGDGFQSYIVEQAQLDSSRQWEVTDCACSLDEPPAPKSAKSANVDAYQSFDDKRRRSSWLW